MGKSLQIWRGFVAEVLCRICKTTTRSRFLGALERVSSRSNPLVKTLRLLASRRGRKRLGQAVIFGDKVIAEALEAGCQFEALVLRGDASPPDWALGRPGRLLALETSLFDELVQVDSPPSALAILKMPEASLAQLGPGALVVACGLQDPGNLGTILRSAFFFGFAGLAWTTGTTDPWGPKVVRAASGALLRRPPVALGQPAEALAAVVAAGYAPVLLTPHRGSALTETVLPSRAAFFMGEEGRGLPEALIDAAQCVTLRGSGEGESLNVAAAFAVVAHAWCAAHGLPGN